MNKKPIEQARDPDLRVSVAAIRRAARRAREIARQTDTAIVISREGVVEYLQPPQTPGTTVRETKASDGDDW